ncbi:MAG: hypothetical protein OQJ81_07360 [Melioribacteraceae bacterium]|nr:hypothetical protein [Melioribacteraceae bacterium]
MKLKLVVFCAVLFSIITLNASDHGIYLLTNKNINVSIDQASSKIAESFKAAGYDILFNDYLKSPDYVREDSSEHCGFKAKLLVLSKDEYTNFLTSYGSKYLVGSFIKIGIYENENGTNVAITDFETINRIIFNDLYENDDEETYNEIIEITKIYKKDFISILHKTIGNKKVEQPMPPIRDDEDLAESSRDMFMMVGPLTLFNDEDQFPVIYSVENKNGYSGLQKLRDEFIKNLKTFEPTEDDIEYRWFPDKSDLKWRVISEINLKDKNAILLGLTRPRTEAVSFNIAGSSREEDKNMCPGIDHVGAYPIEVLIIQEEANINVYTQNEMHRMDMYFWDAGMSAFMDHMSMPGILDESIKKALLGKKINKE